MKKTAVWIRTLYASETARWVFAALAAAALIAIAASLSTITYYDNDDLNIAWTLAGYRTGTPTFSHPFINCIMAFLVGALYAAAAQLPWWLIVQLLGVWIGMTAVFACLLRVGRRSGAPLILPLVLMVIFGAGLYYYGIVLVTFTLSSAALGSGAAAMALAADPADAKKTQRAYGTAACILLAGSLLIRNSSGLAAACFVLGALLCRALAARIRKEKEFSRRALRYAAAAAAVTLALAGVNALGRAALNPEGFTAYDEARSSFMDYPHDSYAANPALYESVGWDGTLAALVESWFYMDERVTTEAFDTIVSGSDFANLGVSGRVSYGTGVLKTFLSKYPLGVYIGVLVCASFAALVLLFLFNRRRRAAFFTGACLLLGAALLLCYLCYAGRMNLRVWMSVCIPACVCGWLAALRLMARDADEKPRRVPRVLGAALLGAVLLVSLLCGYKVFRTVISYESDEMLSRSRAVVSYALAHPDDVYIRDVYAANNVDALSVYPDRKPTNLLDWGGCDTNTAAREAQLAVNHLDSAYAADLFRLDNVYYICDRTDRYLPLLVAYMMQDCGASGYTIADVIDGDIVAVQFEF